MFAEYITTKIPTAEAIPAFSFFGSEVAQTTEDSGDFFQDAFEDTAARAADLMPATECLSKSSFEIPPTHSEYRWEKLEDPTTQVRLVTISRYKGSAETLHEMLGTRHIECDVITTPVPEALVQGKITHHYLRDKPEYEAVSYTWLNYPRAIPLHVEDKYFLKVNASLYACLQRLLEDRDEIILWWDQICIDQTNSEEKSAQISLMREIFGSAKKTTIWLGEEDEALPLALETLNELHSMPNTAIGGSQPSSDSTAKAHERLKVGLRDPNSLPYKRRASVGKLLNRPWFERAWIYQEAAMSRVAVVRIGHYELDLNRFCNSVDAFCAAEQDRVRDFGRSLTTATRGYNTLQVIQQGRKELQAHHRMTNEYLQTLLCRLAGSVKATDERDLVYAFLGFQDQDNPAIKADTSLSAADIYNQTALSLIQHIKTLDIFGITGGERRLPGLASWAPDWFQRLPQGHPIFKVGSMMAFSACKDRKHSGNPTQPPGEGLKVRGRIIDKVSLVQEDDFSLADRNKGGVENFLKLQRLLGYFPVLSAPKEPPVGEAFSNILESLGSGLLGGLGPARKPTAKPEPRKRLLKVLLADGTFSFHQQDVYDGMKEHRKLTDDALESLLEAYDKESAIRQSNTLLHNSEKLKYERQFLREKMLVCYRKRVFSSEASSLGLAPKDVKFGDLICIVHGSRVPIVLRKLEGGKESGEQVYRLVGQCYLEGAMYGEKVNWAENQTDTFLLR
jgi:hypothetical protein